MTVKTNAKWKCWWFLVGTYYLLSLLLFRNQCCCLLSLCLAFLILAFLIVTEKVTDEYWLNQQLHFFNSSVRKSIGNWHWSWGESRKAKTLLNATFSVIFVEHGRIQRKLIGLKKINRQIDKCILIRLDLTMQHYRDFITSLILLIYFSSKQTTKTNHCDHE